MRDVIDDQITLNSPPAIDRVAKEEEHGKQGDKEGVSYDQLKSRDMWPSGRHTKPPP